MLSCARDSVCGHVLGLLLSEANHWNELQFDHCPLIVTAAVFEVAFDDRTIHVFCESEHSSCGLVMVC